MHCQPPIHFLEQFVEGKHTTLPNYFKRGIMFYDQFQATGERVVDMSSLLDHACIVQMLSISRMGEQ